MGTQGTEVYRGFRGEFQKVAEPRLPNNANFVIQWRGMDWSGFRTLEECERQFPELEARDDIEDFTVIEV